MAEFVLGGRQYLHAQMIEDHVQILADLHVIHGNVDGLGSSLLQSAPIVAAQPYGQPAVVVGVFHGFQHVGGIATAGNADHHIPGLEQVFQLFDKHVVIALVIGVGHEGGQVVVEAYEAEAGCPFQTGPLVEVAAEVGCRGRAASVTHDEDAAFFSAGAAQRLDKQIDGVVIQAVNGLLQPLHIARYGGSEIVAHAFPGMVCLL